MRKRLFHYFAIGMVSIALLTSAVPVWAQSPDIEQKLSTTKDDLQKLATIKDDTTLSAEQKAELELKLKKSIIADVIDVSKTQVLEMKKRVSDAILPDSDEWDAIKETLTKSLENATDTLEKSQDTLTQSTTLDELKNVAKEIEATKTAVIDPLLTQANNIAVTASIDSILKLTDQRLEKIGVDINNIYEKKLTKNQSLRKMFDQASVSAKNAHQYNDQATTIVFNLYTPNQGTSTKLFIEKLSTDLALAYEKELDASSTEKRPSEEVLINQHIEELVTKALSQIRGTYDIFMKMSTNVKAYLK